MKGESIEQFLCLLLSDGQSGTTTTKKEPPPARSRFITRARKTTFPGFLSRSCRPAREFPLDLSTQSLEFYDTHTLKCDRARCANVCVCAFVYVRVRCILPHEPRSFGVHAHEVSAVCGQAGM